MNNRLFLLFQQLDKFLLCADVAPDASVDVIEVVDDGGLFCSGGGVMSDGKTHLDKGAVDCPRRLLIPF